MVAGSRHSALGTNVNDVVRATVARLIELGVTQKALLRRMGLHKTWFSRWLNQKREGLQISADALVRLNRYLRELHQASTPIDLDATGDVDANSPPAEPLPKRSRKGLQK